MRIDVRDGVLVEGSADELVAFADAILAAANHGPECVGAFLAPTGVTPVYVLRVGGPPAAVTPVSPPAAARAPSAGGP